MKAKSTTRLVEPAQRSRSSRRKRLPPATAAPEEAQPFRALGDSMLDGAVTLTPGGNILHANLAFAEMMATPFDQLIGKSFFSFVQLGWNQRFFDFLQFSLDKSGTAEISLLTSDKKEISALLTTNAFSVGEEKAVFLTVCDLKCRKQIEEALLRSKQRLETVADLTSNAVWELLLEEFSKKKTAPEITPREQEVLALMAKGNTNKEIAAHLRIGVRTVETHRAQLMKKLKARNAAELSRIALERKLV